MSDAPATRLSLLVRLCDARDDGAWSQFVELLRTPVGLRADLPAPGLIE